MNLLFVFVIFINKTAQCKINTFVSLSKNKFFFYTCFKIDTYFDIDFILFLVVKVRPNMFWCINLLHHLFQTLCCTSGYKSKMWMLISWEKIVLRWRFFYFDTWIKNAFLKLKRTKTIPYKTNTFWWNLIISVFKCNKYIFTVENKDRNI